MTEQGCVVVSGNSEQGRPPCGGSRQTGLGEPAYQYQLPECRGDKTPGIIVSGVGPDAPPTVNERGGKQSCSPYRFDLLDAKAMLRLAAIAGKGAEKYGVDNWRKLDINDNINHALVHLYAYLAGDRQEDHLAHALCRVLFATAQDERES